MSPDAKALLADVELRAEQAVQRRDREDRLAKALKGAATALRMGESADEVRHQLERRYVRIGVEIPA